MFDIQQSKNNRKYQINPKTYKSCYLYLKNMLHRHLKPINNKNKLNGLYITI